MLETKISYQYEKWDYFVVLTFVLTTGTIIWFHYLSPGLSLSIYFLIATINLLVRDRKIRLIRKHSFYYLYIYNSFVGRSSFL